MQFDLTRRLAAEALGTVFLVMAVVGSGIMAEKLAGGNEALALLCNTLATAAVLVVIIGCSRRSSVASDFAPRRFRRRWDSISAQPIGSRRRRRSPIRR
jgi:glycerol uptake facilitator-like aquaporin